MNVIRFIIFALCFHGLCGMLHANPYKLQSPNGKISVAISANPDVAFSVSFGGEPIVEQSPIAMSLTNNMTLGKQVKVRKTSVRSVKNSITPEVPRKFKVIEDHYNELVIDFTGGYQLQFRAYNDGMAYRWVTNFKKEIIVDGEEVNFNFTGDHMVWFPEEKSIYTHQEREYLSVKLSEITPDRFCSTGTLVQVDGQVKVFLSEADVLDYPGMFLQGSASNPYGLTGKFSPYPQKEAKKSDRDVVVEASESYIAKTAGKREFPWRLAIVTANDADLVMSEMVYKLSTPSKIADPSWIKPGKVAWDWWNDNNIYGVDFEAGVNTETYKYYIDFASKYGIEYIVLDEGWYHLDDMMKIKDEVDLEELVAYGKERHVDVILWVTWVALQERFVEAFEVYSKMGVKGFKVDFMQRDDQVMSDFYMRTAQKAADHKMLIDFHGSTKPTGLHRTYPNVISYEAVRGLEQTKWSDWANPDHDLILPFIRMVAGPMDYTPGAMVNATKSNFSATFSQPMSLGTRCHQLAMYVVFESPLQMLADNPSNYYKEPEAMAFLSQVPVVWDDTKVLEAKVGEYILMARRNGDTWYVGSMTNWDQREFNLNLDFLPEGDYTMEIWEDGANAHRHGSDFKYSKLSGQASTVLPVKMAPGGGWVAIIKSKK
ncbi:MAG: glycoside hydrolase family 97 protein [Breznakibacter sp.]